MGELSASAQQNTLPIRPIGRRFSEVSWLSRTIPGRYEPHSALGHRDDAGATVTGAVHTVPACDQADSDDAPVVGIVRLAADPFELLRATEHADGGDTCSNDTMSPVGGAIHTTTAVATMDADDAGLSSGRRVTPYAVVVIADADHANGVDARVSVPPHALAGTSAIDAVAVATGGVVVDSGNTRLTRRDTDPEDPVPQFTVTSDPGGVRAGGRPDNFGHGWSPSEEIPRSGRVCSARSTGLPVVDGRSSE